MKKFFDNFEIYLGAICSGAMIFILLLQVISRYIFNNAFSWSEELAIILFILSVYFGASAAIKTKQHLRLEIILDKVNPKTKLILELIGNFCFGLFNCIILTGFVPIVLRLKQNGTETAVTGIPKWLIYGVLPFLFILMLIRLLEASICIIKKIKSLDSNSIGENSGN
jgi:TRAP-type C4-dicarboxylate transport system permease small subunit